MRGVLLVACLAFLAYVPALFAGFFYDDHRFVEEDPAVQKLSLTSVAGAFVDPLRSDRKEINWTYRPVRTLDFAIDHALSGGAPWFFHLRNILYHLLGSVLVLLLFRRLPVGSERIAVLGALVFALHPVQTEAVAWVTSRADLLGLVLLLTALLLHLKGRVLPAAGVLLAALVTKENAVVFVGLAFLVDRVRRADPAWVAYAVYAGVGAGFTAFWFFFVGDATQEGMWHLSHWWGGSYGDNLLTMAKGFAYYTKLLVFPVPLTLDYYLHCGKGFDTGAALSLVLLLALGLACVRGSREYRFAVGWFFVALLPMSNLLFPIAIPTAERFLFVPSVGVALWAGGFLARFRLAPVVLVCFFALTFVRCFDYRDEDTIWRATLRESPTPASLYHLAQVELRAGRYEAVIDAADEMDRLFAEDLLVTPGWRLGDVLFCRADALLHLNRNEEALAAATRAVENQGGAKAHHRVAVALWRLGRIDEAIDALEVVRRMGWPEDLRRLMARWVHRAAADSPPERARALYERSWAIFPDPVWNAYADPNRR